MSKKKSGRKLTDNELVDSLEHIKYEIDMLLETLKILITQNKLDRIIRNAIVESFIIHARALISFLYYQPKKCDDVMASDFLDDTKWNQLFGSIPPNLNDIRIRAHKEIAHITTFRIGRKLVEKKWDLAGITTGIYKELRVFIDNVPTRLMPPNTRKWFEKQLERSKEFWTTGPVSLADTDSISRST